MTRTRPFFFALMAVLLLCQGTVASSAEPEALEYKVKAAFLLNFAKFITWQEGATATNQNFQICVVGDDPFGAALNGVEGKQVSGQNIVLRRGLANSEDLGSCRLLFLSPSEKNNLSRVFKAIADKPVATVSDIDGFAEAGGIFEFRDQSGRLSFVINNTKARERGMRISASLLNLAMEVR